MLARPHLVSRLRLQHFQTYFAGVANPILNLVACLSVRVSVHGGSGFCQPVILLHTHAPSILIGEQRPRGRLADLDAANSGFETITCANFPSHRYLLCAVIVCDLSRLFIVVDYM